MDLCLGWHHRHSPDPGLALYALERQPKGCLHGQEGALD